MRFLEVAMAFLALLRLTQKFKVHLLLSRTSIFFPICSPPLWGRHVRELEET